MHSTLFHMSTAPDRQPAVRLVMVTGENNNKVYEMAANGDGTFTARYGRIGAKLQTRTYPMQRWERTYREKTRKGYADVTSLAAETADAPFDIASPEVAALVDVLRAAADRAIQAQYLVGPSEVGPRQVQEAQAHLDALAGLAASLSDAPDTASPFDERLLALYTTIPRKMTDVRAHLLAHGLAPDDVPAMLDGEQEALDRMAQRVRLAEAPTAPTLLEALGFDLRPVTDARVLADLRREIGAHAELVRAVEIEHPHLRTRFEAHVAASSRKTTRRLWHGSRSENWLSILETGLVLNPARAVITGKMFGHGLYFADSFQKSLGYTSLWGSRWTGGGEARGFLALCDVHLGRALAVHRHEAWCYELDAGRLATRGMFRTYDSLHARSGSMLVHDELVVYNEAQVCPRYLIEVSLPDPS